jgi:potassium efflux system protein
MRPNGSHQTGRGARGRALSDGFVPFCAALLFALCLGLAGAASAQGASEVTADWDTWTKEAAAARSLIEAGEPTADELSHIRAEAEAQRDAAKTLAEKATADITRLEAEVQALGPPPEDGAAPETPEAIDLRKDVSANLAEAKAKLGQAQQVSTRAATLINDISALGQRRFLNQLETRGPTPLGPQGWAAALNDLATGLREVSDETAASFSSAENRDMIANRAPLAVLALVVSGFILFGVRGAALGLLFRTAGAKSGRRRRLALGVGATAARLLTAAVAGGLLLYAASTSGILGPMGEAVLGGVARGLIYLIGAYTLAAALFSPNAAALRMSAIPNSVAKTAFRATMLTAAAIALDVILQFFVAATDAKPEAGAVLSFIALLLAALSFYRLVYICKPQSSGSDGLSIGSQVFAVMRRAAMVAAVLAPLLALAGYEFAARTILLPTIHSAGLIAAGYLIFALIQEAVEVHLIDRQKEEEEEEEDKEERLRLIPVIVGFLLLCVGAPILALIWGASLADLMQAYDVAVAGFVVGDVALSPMDFVTFAVVFGVGYTLTCAAQRVLGGTVLPKTGMTAGGASALTAGVGYVGVIIAALVAISTTGIDLSNLAIVAGALSVGIGFGLQTIVSNFVSGIILLIERPVKVGDWVSVGTSQGYVKKVNVRSTEIEGFDRSSFIVPNSDLISSTVLNMTHSDKIGRVIVPIGVAYGTDPRQIEKILLELANEHPLVIATPAPTAYFMNFGADALEFELRVFLGDVNWMIVVKSDLNFAIAKRFADEGIEIPFAQRDLHIRNPEALAAALRGEKADVARIPKETTIDGSPGPAPGVKPDGEAPSLPDSDAPGELAR